MNTLLLKWERGYLLTIRKHMFTKIIEDAITKGSTTKLVARGVPGIVFSIRSGYGFILTYYGKIYFSEKVVKDPVSVHDVVIVDVCRSERAHFCTQVRSQYCPETLSASERDRRRRAVTQAKTIQNITDRTVALQKLLSTYPNDKYVITELINACFKHKLRQPDQIEYLLQRGLFIAPLDPYLLNLAGKFYIQQGDLRKAKLHLRHLLMLKPNFPSALMYQGFIAQLERERTTAKTYYHMAIDAEPRNPIAARGLVLIAFEEQDIVAMERYQHVLDRAAPYDPRTYFYRALLYCALEKWEEAFELVNRNISQGYRFQRLYDELCAHDGYVDRERILAIAHGVSMLNDDITE